MKRIRGDMLIGDSSEPKPVESWVTDGLLLFQTDAVKLWIFNNGAWVPMFKALASGDPSSGDAATWDGSDSTWTAN